MDNDASFSISDSNMCTPCTKMDNVQNGVFFSKILLYGIHLSTNIPRGYRHERERVDEGGIQEAWEHLHYIGNLCSAFIVFFIFCLFFLSFYLIFFSLFQWKRKRASSYPRCCHEQTSMDQTARRPRASLSFLFVY